MIESDYSKVGPLLLTDNLSDMLKRASEGDVGAAQEALAMMAYILNPANIHPIPDYVRQYVSDALNRVARRQCDANTAFNLKRPGRRKRPHIEKRLAADLVRQAVQQGAGVEDACWNAAEFINEISARNAHTGRWHRFNGEVIQPEMLMTWYYEMKHELDAIHKAASDT